MTSSWLAQVDRETAAEWVDAEERGLRLRIRRGRAVWSLRKLVAGAHVRFTIGEYPAVGLAAARKAARKAKANEDPQAERRAARLAGREAARRRKLGETVKGALGTWLKDRKAGPRARWKGGLTGGSARSFLGHVRRLERDLGDVVLTELQPKDVERFVGAPEGANTRNNALSVARTFLTWARRKRLLERTGAEGLTAEIARERTTERTRVLTEGELQALLAGFAETRYGLAVRLLALTALRKDEVMGMRWAWVDTRLAVVTIPPEAEKSGARRGEERRVPLSTAAVDVLKAQRAALFAEGVSSDFVFATSTGARPHPDALKATLNRLRGRRAHGLPASKAKGPRPPALAADVTVHDVRRTVANALSNQYGASPWVVDYVVLGHVRPKLLRTYQPAAAIDEARPALEAWGAHVTGLAPAAAQA